MKRKLTYILILISYIGFSQQNPVEVYVDTTQIKIGEQIKYIIKVNNAKTVIFPKLKLDSLKKIEVVKTLPTDSLKNSFEKKYILTSFDSGTYKIPQQEIAVNNKKLLTKALEINVLNVKVDTTKQGLYPIKSIKKEPKTWADYNHLFWWIVSVILLLLLAIGLILYFLLKKKKEKGKPKVYIPPIQEALQRLKKLDEKQLLQQEKLKIYYSELTDIVRTYIEKDIKIPALESTTNELISTITDFNNSSKLAISKETIANLKEILTSADLVKFAKSKPLLNEVKKHRVLSEEIIQQLKPKKTEDNEVG